MRVIKFRAWYKRHNKIYNYVEHVTYPDGSSCTGCIGYLEGERMFSPDDNEVELMQYTGIKDKNGKEIYEGDIIRVDDESVGEIKYGVGCFYFQDEFDGKIALEDIQVGRYAVVIGNVYEHPHLLPVEGEA